MGVGDQLPQRGSCQIDGLNAARRKPDPQGARAKIVRPVAESCVAIPHRTGSRVASAPGLTERPEPRATSPRVSGPPPRPGVENGEIPVSTIECLAACPGRDGFPLSLPA